MQRICNVNFFVANANPIVTKKKHTEERDDLIGNHKNRHCRARLQRL